jgi:hypothetical protein
MGKVVPYHKLFLSIFLLEFLEPGKFPFFYQISLNPFELI